METEDDVLGYDGSQRMLPFSGVGMGFGIGAGCGIGVGFGGGGSGTLSTI